MYNTTMSHVTELLEEEKRNFPESPDFRNAVDSREEGLEGVVRPNYFPLRPRFVDDCSSISPVLEDEEYKYVWLYESIW